MTQISDEARAALYAAHTDAVILRLLTIDHDSLGAPIRLVRNTENITSRGNVYTAFAFDIDIPAADQNQIELVVDNVTRELLDEVEAIDTPLEITLEIVLAHTPDTVEDGPYTFESRAAEYDAQRLRFTLAYEPILNERFPGDSYTPTSYPGMYQAVDR
jgi:hypothetical protein